MAITLVETRREIEDGDHVFRIYGVENDESAGAIALHLVTAEGYRHTERFYYKTKAGVDNPTALEMFSTFALAALNYPDDRVIEPEILLGKYVKCAVEHYEEKGYQDETKTYKKIKLGYKRYADGFEPDKKVSKIALTLSQSDIRPALASTKEAMARERRAHRAQARTTEATPVISQEVEDIFKA